MFAAALEVVSAVAAQVSGLTASLDVGALVVWAAGGLVSVLLVIASIAAKRLLTSFDALGKNVDEKLDKISDDVAGVERGVQTLTQEMFGVSGQNGMRGTLKSIERTVIRHDRTLIRLSAQAGVSAAKEESA